MTLAQEVRESGVGVALEPRTLVSDELFDKIVSYVVADKKVTREYASEMFGQCLVFLKAHADSLRSTAPGLPLPDGKRYRVVPDATVDEGWHAFLQFTEDYTEFCERIAGTYLHHRPIMTKEMADGTAMEHTLPALHATGYRVNLEFWRTAYSCCPPECAGVGVED